jgi:ABC-type transporter Mla MlaB component
MAASRQVGRKSRARKRADSAHLALGPSLTIVQARSLQRSLNALLERGRADADAHALENVDTAGLQLLLAAGRAARARGLTLRLSGARALLLDAATTLGLVSALTEVVELTP